MVCEFIKHASANCVVRVLTATGAAAAAAAGITVLLTAGVTVGLC